MVLCGVVIGLFVGGTLAAQPSAEASQRERSDESGAPASEPPDSAAQAPTQHPVDKSEAPPDAAGRLLLATPPTAPSTPVDREMEALTARLRGLQDRRDAPADVRAALERGLATYERVQVVLRAGEVAAARTLKALLWAEVELAERLLARADERELLRAGQRAAVRAEHAAAAADAQVQTARAALAERTGRRVQGAAEVAQPSPGLGRELGREFAPDPVGRAGDSCSTQASAGAEP